MAVKNLFQVIANIPDFLSRLCGGEVFFRLADWLIIFLSRLCGGEGSLSGNYTYLYFLSRLCGGEACHW